MSVRTVPVWVSRVIAADVEVIIGDDFSFVFDYSAPQGIQMETD